jgi:hypothetical protein
MAARIQDNTLKGILLVILFFVLLVHGFVAGAQSYRGEELYKGFVASFGAHTSDLSSDIAEIHATVLQQAGGEIGLIAGNRIAKAKLGLIGYYSSTGSTPGTTDLYTSNVSVNFYPLAWILKKNPMVEPYFTGGVDYDNYKFYGFYVNREPGQTNYSQADAPYLGRITQVNGTFGAGIELRLKDDYNFIHLFAEARYGHSLSSTSNGTLFSATTISNQTQMTVGVTFGGIR